MTSEDMIERVARAIYEKRRARRQTRSRSWGELSPNWQAYWFGEARVAIEAMREPTKEMWQAGTVAAEERREFSTNSHHEYECTDYDALAVPVFQAMIDAALRSAR